jgi:hypothetical protein
MSFDLPMPTAFITVTEPIFNMVVATTAFCDCVAFGGFHEG